MDTTKFTPAMERLYQKIDAMLRKLARDETVTGVTSAEDAEWLEETRREVTSHNGDDDE